MPPCLPLFKQSPFAGEGITPPSPVNDGGGLGWGWLLDHHAHVDGNSAARVYYQWVDVHLDNLWEFGDKL